MKRDQKATLVLALALLTFLPGCTRQAGREITLPDAVAPVAGASTAAAPDTVQETVSAEERQALQAALSEAAAYLPAVDAPAWQALESAKSLATQAAASDDPAAVLTATRALVSAMRAMDDRIEIRDGLTFVDGILILNKTYGAPVSYAPGNDPDAKAALGRLIAAARADDVTLTLDNGYRSYDLQTSLYNKYVKRDGKAAADRYSARPGHSEHQSGLCFDIKEAFRDGDPSIRWIAENCVRFGFVIRYPEGKEAVTGYLYEPWHIRYVGETLAARLDELDLTLEEYLGITSVYGD